MQSAQYARAARAASTDLPAEQAFGSQLLWQLRRVSLLTHRVIQMMQHAQKRRSISTSIQVFLACIQLVVTQSL